MAALQEQRAAFGTRYEVPEVSFSNSHCNVSVLYRKYIVVVSVTPYPRDGIA